MWNGLRAGVLLSLALVAGGAAGQGVPERYPLLVRTAVGDKAEIEWTSDSQLSLSVSSGDQSSPTQEASSRARSKYLEETLAVKGAVPTAVRRTYAVDREQMITALGEEKITTSSLQGKTVTVKRQGGKTVVTASKGKVAAKDQKTLVREALGLAHNTFLPGREASVGEEWVLGSEALKQFFTQARSGSVRVKFQEVAPFQGRNCAHLSFSGNVVLNVTGMPAPLKVQLSGKAYYSLALQRLVGFDFTGPVSMDHEVQREGWTLSYLGTGELAGRGRLRWLRVAAKPAPEG